MGRLSILVVLLLGCDSENGSRTGTDAGDDAGDDACTSHEACGDGLYCSGTEQCMPGASGADAKGCIRGASPCMASESCDEIGDRCVTITCEAPPTGSLPVRTTCVTDADCTYGSPTCSATEQCLPTHPSADPYGCIVSGTACPIDCLVTDNDADDHWAIECGGDDCDDYDQGTYPGAREVCGAQAHDEDCDFETFGLRDADGDGHDDSACCNVEPISRTEYCGNDCDDHRADVGPTSTESCDLRDNDCDTNIDEGVQVMLYADADGDGYGVESCGFRACAGTPGYATSAGDCNDANPAIGPGSIECSATPEEVRVCVDGTWTDERCTAGTRCVPQPNGTGICLP